MITAASRLAPLIAHQYGWDEIVMFLVPIGLAVAGVRYAEKRAAAKKQVAAETAATDEPSTPTEPHES